MICADVRLMSKRTLRPVAPSPPLLWLFVTSSPNTRSLLVLTTVLVEINKHPLTSSYFTSPTTVHWVRTVIVLGVSLWLRLCCTRLTVTV